VRWAGPAAACALIVALAAPARADRAEQLFKKGKKLLADKRYAEACTAFEDSDRLDPGIGAKLNVARCYEEWGKLATAWRWYADAEQMARAAKDDRASKIHALIAALDPAVPRLIVRLPREIEPRAAVVKLDGIELEAAAIGAERRADPGPHQIEYVINGARQTKTIPLERGASSEVVLDAPKRVAGKKGRPADPPTDRVDRAEPADADPGRTRRLAGLGVSAAGVVAIGVAGYLGVSARSDYRAALTDHCRGAADMCDDAGLAATHDARHRANIATVVSLVGLAAVGGGVVLYLTAPRGAARDAEHALYLAPTAGRDGAGVVLGGAF
jgi:hypothetical protein